MDHVTVDFLDGLGEANHLADLRRQLTAQTAEFGIDFFAYHVIRPPEPPFVPWAITSFPTEFAERYASLDYVNIDPAITAIAHRVTPLEWRDFSGAVPKHSRMGEFLDEARDFGLGEGMTVPVHGPGGGLAAFSASCHRDNDRGRDIIRAHRYDVHLTALYSHEAIVRCGRRKSAGEDYPLTERERECLLWTSRGKSAWEASEIIGISRDTVNAHLKSAMKKFHVFSKHHAVVKAVMMGLIVP